MIYQCDQDAAGRVQPVQSKAEQDVASLRVKKLETCLRNNQCGSQQPPKCLDWHMMAGINQWLQSFPLGPREREGGERESEREREGERERERERESPRESEDGRERGRDREGERETEREREREREEGRRRGERDRGGDREGMERGRVSGVEGGAREREREGERGRVSTDTITREAQGSWFQNKSIMFNF